MLSYDPALIERFPAIRAGVVRGTGLRNEPSSTELRDEFVATQTKALARLEETTIAAIPSIAAWRRAFTAFGVKPTQHRVAAEALLRRLSKTSEIPSINTLVDMGNLVSTRFAVPVAVMDQRSVTGSTTIRFATGEEQFTDLGSERLVNPEPGEVIFVDELGIVSARRWCWRQSAQSAAKSDTTEVLFTIEALHEDAEQMIASAVADLEDLLVRHQPEAELTSHVLSPQSPSAPVDFRRVY